MAGQPLFRDEDELAARLGRLWDALASDDGTADQHAWDEVAETRAFIGELAALPRDPAPEAFHDRAKALFSASSAWRMAMGKPPRPVVSPFSQNGHGYAPRASVVREPVPIGRTRRLIPALQVAVLAVVATYICYLAFVRDRHAAAPVQTPIPAATVAVTPSVIPGGVGDWPMLGGGPARASGVDRAIPTAKPEVTWSVTLATGYRAPVAAGDALYLTNGGELVALDAATGGERWRFDLGVQPSVPGANPPAVVDGIVYVAAQDGTVFALNGADGRIVWSVETGETVTTAVAVADGLLYAGTVTGHLFALDAKTGAQRWVVTTGAITGSSPVVAGGVVYVGAGSDTLLALDAATGATIWSDPIMSGLQSVAVGENIVVVAGVNTGSANLLIAVDAGTGATRWRGGGADQMPPAIAGGFVYVTNGMMITAFDSATGAQHWVYSAKGTIVSAAVTGDALLVCQRDGSVIAVNGATGVERWNVVTGGEAVGIALGDGEVYVLHADGSLVAYSD